MNDVSIVYQIRPRKDHKGFDLISDALPFGRLWYNKAEDAAHYAGIFSRPKRVEVQFFNADGVLIEVRRQTEASSI